MGSVAKLLRGKLSSELEGDWCNSQKFYQSMSIVSYIINKHNGTLLMLIWKIIISLLNL